MSLRHKASLFVIAVGAILTFAITLRNSHGAGTGQPTGDWRIVRATRVVEKSKVF